MMVETVFCTISLLLPKDLVTVRFLESGDWFVVARQVLSLLVYEMIETERI